MKNSSPIRVHHHYATLPCPLRKVNSLFKALYEGENVSKEQRTDIILCSDYYIKKLNASYRSKNYATDVLSFPFNEPDYLGEIYVSLQRVKIHARRVGISYDDELQRLLVHGFFHLIGYDHQTVKERDEMEQKEQNYFNVEFI
jgi:probable rRNA maturation factor